MLSVGPYSYNRFDAYEKSLQEASKPDYLDFDKDGDKEEPMKKALKEKGKKKEVKESNCTTGHQEGGKVEKKSPCEKCKEEGKKDCNCDDKKSKGDKKMPPWLKGKDVKESIMNQLMADGLANNPVSAEIITEHMSEAWAEAILSDLD